MTKLHYAGFNGYGQFPQNESETPKVITKWTSIAADGTLKGCTHRFILLETAEFIEIFGLLSDTSLKRHQVITKPAGIDNFGGFDEFMIASKGTNVWKYSFKNSEWTECKLKFFNEEERVVWGEAGNTITKFSFLLNHDVVFLLSSGSVWMLTDNTLKLMFPYDADRAVDICSGLEHTLILTESGCVLSFGNGSRGQLGHGDLNPAPLPVQITALEGLKVRKIATGGWHSCALTDSGDLYTWGWNNYGQLSAFEDGEEIGVAALPVVVEVGEEPDVKVEDVACGMRHTLVCLENGDLYATGWNAYKQLGVDSTCDKISQFIKCQISRGICGRIVCGPWYTILVEEEQRSSTTWTNAYSEIRNFWVSEENSDHRGKKIACLQADGFLKQLLHATISDSP